MKSEACNRIPSLVAHLIFPSMYSKTILTYEFLCSAAINTLWNHYVGAWIRSNLDLCCRAMFIHFWPHRNYFNSHETSLFLYQLLQRNRFHGGICGICLILVHPLPHGLPPFHQPLEFLGLSLGCHFWKLNIPFWPRCKAGIQRLFFGITYSLAFSQAHIKRAHQ